MYLFLFLGNLSDESPYHISLNLKGEDHSQYVINVHTNNEGKLQDLEVEKRERYLASGSNSDFIRTQTDEKVKSKKNKNLQKVNLYCLIQLC